MYLKNRIGPCIWPQTNFKPHQKENMQIKMVSIKGKVYNNTLQSTLALWTPCYYGHPDNTDSCWIPSKKLQTFWLKQTPNITDLQAPLLVPTRISISTFRHFGRIISVYNIFLPLPLFVPVTLVEKWTFWFPFKMIPSIKLPYLLQGSMLRPVGSLLWPAFTLSGD